MRLGVALVAVAAALVGAHASAAPAPTYAVSFPGAGSEHQVDQKQNVEDDGSCEAAEHVDVTASLTWSASWSKFRPAARTTLAAPSQIAGSRVSGSHVVAHCHNPYVGTDRVRLHIECARWWDIDTDSAPVDNGPATTVRLTGRCWKEVGAAWVSHQREG